MRRILFLSLIVFCSIFFVLSQETLKAIKIDEFGLTTECDLGLSVDEMFLKLENYPNGQIHIVQYNGTEESPTTWNGVLFAKNRRRIEKHLSFNKYDPTKIVYVDGGFRKNFSNEVWIVPKESEPPVLTNRFFKVLDFGNVSEKVWKANLEKLYKENNKEGSQFYVTIFGPSKSVALLAKKYLNYSVSLRGEESNCCPIKVIHWGVTKNIRTVVWVVPVDSPIPTPPRFSKN